jgi:hypothetical protein
MTRPHRDFTVQAECRAMNRPRGPNFRSDFFLADGEKIVKRKRSREVIFS